MIAPQKGRIFISYRRTDSAGYAGRIFDRLSAHFGEEAVFMDVDTIEAGLDFVAVLQNAVQSCDVLVALIGRSWLTIKDEAGKRRLDNPEDFVRVEIAAALSRDIRVIPVLVDGAPMPRSTELPGNLKPLARRNALQVNHHSFNADAHRLIAQLELALKAAEDSDILKARVFQEEQARAWRQAEIQRLLDGADLAISLNDWKLAQEKLNGVLALDASHVGARDKLDIVQRKLSEIEGERAEQARKEQAAREQAAAEENADREESERKAIEKARWERIAREKKAAEEKTRKVMLREARQQEATERIKNLFRGERNLPFFIGGGIIILFLLGYVIKSAVAPSTLSPPIETSSTLALSSATLTSIELPIEITFTPTSRPEPRPTTIDTPVPTFTPVVMISEKDGMTMVHVPAGEFRIGSENGVSDEKPFHRVDLDPFWIDRTEVTNAMYAKCVDAGACDPPSLVKSSTRDNYFGDAEFDGYPVIYISWNDAIAYCDWAGRRLPTEAEWEKAARGTDERVYPWGNTIDESYANYNQNVGDTTAVGSYERGASFYGAYDMAGNVWEWNSSIYQSYPYSMTDGREDLSVDRGRVLRGGSWLNLNHNVRSASRSWSGPASSNYLIGFRCSRSQ